ncbi:conserved hypothetical protein [Leishmania infantum JPCM5]|uniref:Uncharacterized protein n=2 Tax=Leishmania infantum TaxID=5671 RepID=A4HW36_LEIIN|nr:conserved hypothetical protein [Leishmania infantum JPCM5]CAC9469478.1 hypothetical_protein_-_conserved [Leishmania infantum]CAM66658.2 conserved hypothetical protein [Leishmania infantum JPCM5]SUZ40330.1 hypothetical_protein_-_conserved [Leishmania infantum]|eukprot:XP_001464277.2 conserved hypothetical protein [Leishmania infantum JPCM5]
MLLASASSFRGTQHGAHRHHSARHQSSALYGAGTATPETSNLYQSLGSINVTVGANSNNPYIGVRMTPETTLLQPQSVVHGRSAEAGPRTAVEIKRHLLSFYDAQPLESSLSREPNQHETRLREAQQPWMTSALPMQVVPVHAHGSRHSNPQSSPVAAALGEGNRNPSGAPFTASEGYAIMTNRPPGLMPTVINQVERTYLEPRSPVLPHQQQQQQGPHSLPSCNGTPYEGWVRGYSPHSAVQQQRAPPQQRALHISPSYAAAMPAAGSTTISIHGNSVGDASRTRRTACDATRQFSPLPTIAFSVSPAPLVEMELALDDYSSSSLTESMAEDNLQHQQATIPAPSPHRPYTAVSPARPRCATRSPFATPPRYRDACAYALDSTQTGLPSDTEPQSTPASRGTAAALLYSRQHSSSDAGACSADGEKVQGNSDVRLPSQHSYGEASSAKAVPAHTLAEVGASQCRPLPSVQLMPAAATNGKSGAVQTPKESHPLSGAPAYRAQGENDVEDTDEDGKGGGDDEDSSLTAPDAAQRKKKRVRRNRKPKALEDLPPATSMKYLPPPPPPPPPPALPTQPDPSGAAVNDAPSSSAFDRYYAVLLRWYTRLLADEADFVDIATASSFDAATAVAAMSAEARQARDGSYAADDKLPSACPLQHLDSGPISSPMGSISPSLMSKPSPAYFGSSGSGSGSNAEVHVRCPRIEQYMDACDIPAELRLFPTPNTAGAQATGAAPAALPQSVKDVPSAVRWARDLETWWFCYVFPHAARTRHQSPTAWPQMQPASMSLGSLTIPHTGSGGALQDYPYGWSTTMPQPMMTMNSIPGVYVAHGSAAMGSGHPMIANRVRSPVGEHISMHHQMPPPPPPMPPGYSKGLYSTY